MKKIINFLLSQKKYLKNPRGSRLTTKEYKSLLLGLILSEQNGYYVDTLETGKPIDKLKKQLEDYYNVTNKKSTKETINLLFTKGTRYYFDKLKAGYENSNFNITKISDTTEELEDLTSYSKNLISTLDYLERYDFLNSLEDIKDANILAWDLGRIVHIARCAYECGYLKEAEVWELIDHCYEIYTKNFKTIESYAASYAIGRAMFAGLNNPFISITAIIYDLLKDKNSPWKIFNKRRTSK